MAQGTLLPEPVSCMSARQGGIVSTRWSASFQGPERRSCPLPISQRCLAVRQTAVQSAAHLGIDSLFIHRQALASLSWLSSSRPRDLPAVPGCVASGDKLSPVRLLPTSAHVERSRRDRTPWEDLQCSALLTHFVHDDRSENLSETACPHRPHSGH